MTVEVLVGAPGVERSEALSRWSTEGYIERLWDGDPSIWFDPPRDEISNRLGWLNLPETSRPLVETIGRLAEDARESGISDLVLCGMGGSSLAPEVFAATIPTEGDRPRLTVIDTTHPDAIRHVTTSTDPSTTWYLVSSKSGGTLETMSLFRHFWGIASDALDDPGSHFIAVTDPGSSLQELGSVRRFRETVLADPNVGGRYSALSAFGLVPAGIIGIDVARLLDRAAEASAACGPDVALEDNPGYAMGSILGEAARSGRPIAYFDASEPAGPLPIWIEQLIAESTGKEGSGIVPIAGGPLPDDRTHAVMVSMGARPDPGADITMRFEDPYDVAGAMFLLEIATAIAGEVLGIHPFDQPDVQLAKTLAHQAMSGELVAEGPRPIALHDPALPSRLVETLGASRLYVSVQAYTPYGADHAVALGAMREAVCASTNRFVTVGYGPRFLHSTGQLHKGGPDGGVFLQFVDEPESSVDVPETDYSFNQLISAQAAGDRAALAERDRVVLAIDLGRSGAEGLEEFTEMLVELADGD